MTLNTGCTSKSFLNELFTLEKYPNNAFQTFSNGMKKFISYLETLENFI